MNAVRLGLHTGLATWKSVNSVPCAASLSRLGVRMFCHGSGLYAPTSPQPQSSAKMKTTFSLSSLGSDGFAMAMAKACWVNQQATANRNKTVVIELWRSTQALLANNILLFVRANHRSNSSHLLQRKKFHWRHQETNGTRSAKAALLPFRTISPPGRCTRRHRWTSSLARDGHVLLLTSSLVFTLHNTYSCMYFQAAIKDLDRRENRLFSSEEAHAKGETWRNGLWGGPTGCVAPRAECRLSFLITLFLQQKISRLQRNYLPRQGLSTRVSRTSAIEYYQGCVWILHRSPRKWQFQPTRLSRNKLMVNNQITRKKSATHWVPVISG